jgi:hypothetical protein
MKATWVTINERDVMSLSSRFLNPRVAYLMDVPTPVQYRHDSLHRIRTEHHHEDHKSNHLGKATGLSTQIRHRCMVEG